MPTICREGVGLQAGVQGEGVRTDGYIQGNFQISLRRMIDVFYHNPSPPHFQVLPDARAERGELPSARH